MNFSRTFDKLILELVEQASKSEKTDPVAFAQWAVEQSINARQASKLENDQEMYNISEALAAGGLVVLLANGIDADSEKSGGCGSSCGGNCGSDCGGDCDGDCGGGCKTENKKR